METRSARAETYYNGKLIKTTLENFMESFEYSDPDSGESDSVALTIGDPEQQWIAAWMPSKGDEIKSVIVFENRDKDGQEQKLDCGTFTIDNLSFSDSGGAGVFKIDGVSAPAADAFSATERTQTWEQVTLKKVAQTIADRYHLELVYDADDIKLATKEQSGTSDSSFLATICGDYGRCLKVYRKKIVIFDREAYKQKPPVATIDKAEMSDFGWNTTLAGTYTGGSIAYTDGKKGADLTYKTGDGKRLLKVNTKADSIADAKALLDAAIAAANHGMTQISFSTMGRPDLVASQTITVTGFGKLSGKYYIDKKTDSLGSSGYVTKIEASLVHSGTQAVVYDAIDRLHSIAVLSNPEYWKTHWQDIGSLGGLLINMATVIRENKNLDTYDGKYSAALKRLEECGVINNTAYWEQHKRDVSGVQQLVIDAANAL